MEVNADFFQPRTVICDSREGIQAQEFPLFNYCIVWLWKIFGVHNWCFRLFNLLIASIGLYYFSKIGQRLLGERGALYATAIMGISVAFMYSRKAMPDVFAVSLVIMGVSAAWKYLETRKATFLGVFLVLTALGLLCKMPAACVLGLLTAPMLDPQKSRASKIWVAGTGMAALAIMGAWYFIWVPWAEKTYEFPLFYPTRLAEGWQQLVAMQEDTLSRFYPIALTSRLAFVCCVIGLIAMFVKKNWPLVSTWLVSSALIFALMLKAGAVFAGHVYYIIPYVPVMSLLAGYGLKTAIRWEHVGLVAMVAIIVEGIYWHRPDFFIPWENRKFLKLEAITDQYVPKNARVMTVYLSGSPVMMYAAHRRGWTVNPPPRDTSWLNSEATVGLHYAIVERIKWHGSLPYPLLFEDNDFQIYKIKKD